MATRDIAELGIVVDARQTQAATRALDDLDQQGKRTAGSMKFLTDTAKLLAAAFAAIKLVKLLEETALLNARFETMGVVMRVAGNNAGYTGAQMAALEQDLTKTGISMIKARENLTSLATANIDLSKATKLARAAQDLAVVGNVNSSEAFSRLVNGIKTGEVEVLRTLGLNVNFENSYKKLAGQLGTTSDKLTDLQKTQARTDAALQAATRYAGIYEEAMGTAGKQIKSLERYVEDAKVKVGELFNESLTFAVGETTKALKAANDELDKMGGSGGSADAGHMLAVGFQEAFKAVMIFGANVLFVLNTIGREVGGFAAILGQVFIAPLRAVNALGAALDAALSGDFKGAAAKAQQAFDELGNGIRNVGDIWTDLDKQGEAARAALDAYEASIMSATIKTKEQTQAEKDAADALEKKRIAAGEAGRAQDILDAKALAAKEAAAKVAKKLQADADEFYKKTKDNAVENIGVLNAELNSTEDLTDAQKKALVVMLDVIKYSAQLSDAKKRTIADLTEEELRLERVKAARVADKKAQQEAEDAAKNETDAAFEKARAMQKEIEYFGLTEEAVLKLKAVELERQLQNGDLSELETRRASMLLEATNQQYDAQVKLTKLKADAKFWTGLEGLAHSTFMSIENGNKGLWERMKETAKNAFFEWLYQQTLKKWIINIGASLSGNSAVSGISDAAAVLGGGTSSSGSTVGNAASLFSIGKTIYNGFTAGLAGSLGSAVSGLGSLIGSEAVSAFGAGLTGGSLGASTAAASSGYAGTAAAGAGAGAAGAIPIIGWIITGMMASKGLLAQGWDAHNGSVNQLGLAAGGRVALQSDSLLQKLGMSKVGANILSGQATIAKLFGRKNPEIESQGIRGTLTSTGTTNAENYANILQKGGWFRSDKRWTEKGAASTETDSLFDSTMQAIVKAVKGFGAAVGIETSKIDAYTKVFDVKLTGNAETDNAAVAKLFADVGDELAQTLVPNLKNFSAEGETLSATLQRLVVDYVAVDGVLQAVGLAVKAVGVAGIDARENLIKAFGGLDALAKGVEFYQQNFLTAAQQLDPVQKQVTAALSAMGLSSLKTVDDFTKYVSGIDLSTQAGADLFAKLMALAPAFKTVTDAAASAREQAARDQAAQDAKAAQEHDKLLDLQAQTYEALGNKIGAANVLEQQRAIILSGLSPVLQQATKELWAAQDAAAAIAKAQESAAVRQEAISDFGNSLVESMQRASAAAAAFRDLNAALLVGGDSTLSAQDKYVVARRAFDMADGASLAGAQKDLLAASKALQDPLQYARDFAAVYLRNQGEAAYQDGLASPPRSIYEAGVSVIEKEDASAETNELLRQVLAAVESSDRNNKKTADVLQGATRGGTSLAIQDVSTS